MFKCLKENFFTKTKKQVLKKYQEDFKRKRKEQLAQPSCARDTQFSKEKIGPHNKDVISVLVGNLLGDGYGEKIKNKSRFQINISSRNAEYVFWLHKFFASQGYSSPKKPVPKKQIGKKNTVYFSIKFKTFCFSSLNFLYDSFYSTNKKNIEKTHRKAARAACAALLVKIEDFKSKEVLNSSIRDTKKSMGRDKSFYPFQKPTHRKQSFLQQKNNSWSSFVCIPKDTFLTTEKKKTVPTNIYSLLTQQALAIWIMDQGEKSYNGLKINTKSFCFEENLLLQKTLKTKFNLQPSIQRHKDKFSLYFKSKQIFSLYSIVKPYILPCMRYKFNVESIS
uniref:Putative site-specific DNA endonuclease n=1 Tax=Trebouxia aggregata TaxID=160068 RepID=G8XP87_9CHLO|nr:putative site-specific DNA endonuclease [Trebouxia aggregata]